MYLQISSIFHPPSTKSAAKKMFPFVSDEEERRRSLRLDQCRGGTAALGFLLLATVGWLEVFLKQFFWGLDFFFFGGVERGRGPPIT